MSANVHILWPSGLFYRYLVYFVTIGYYLWLFGTFLSSFVMFYQEKSGNPVPLVKFEGGLWQSVDKTAKIFGIFLSEKLPRDQR
jgi:hypothetical protein